MYNIQSSRWMQIQRQSVHPNTHSKTCGWKDKCSIDRYSHSSEWWTTDVTTNNSVGWQDPTPSKTSSPREQVRFQKRKIGNQHLESSRPCLKVCEIQTLEHSKKGLSNGLWAWKKKRWKQLGFYTRTCSNSRFQVHILRIEIGASNRVPRAMLLHFLW